MRSGSADNRDVLTFGSPEQSILDMTSARQRRATMQCDETILSFNILT